MISTQKRCREENALEKQEAKFRDPLLINREMGEVDKQRGY